MSNKEKEIIEVVATESEEIQPVEVKSKKPKKVKRTRASRGKTVKVVNERNPRKVDLSTQDETKTISKKKKKELVDLETQGASLLRGLDDLKGFKGGKLEKIDEKLYALQQKAIKIELKIHSLFLKRQEVKIELKIHSLFLKRQEVKIEGITLETPEKMTQEILEDAITAQQISPAAIPKYKRVALKKLKQLGVTKEKPWDPSEKKALKPIPEVPYTKEGKPKVGRLVLKIPPKLLSRADHVFEVIANRFADFQNIKLSHLFEKNYFQLLRKTEAKKRKEMFNSIGAYSWIGDYHDVPFYRKKLGGVKLSLSIMPQPFIHFALKNKKIMKKIYDSFKLTKFPWSRFELRPFKYESLQLTPLSPSSSEYEESALHKKPLIPPYWKKIREKARYFASSLHKEFLENFGEFDLLNYGKWSWDIVKQLRDRYFGNHLNRDEMRLPANQEIEPELNSMMKLLNEQPFLVFPLGASPAMYSILPELDGITTELFKHKISPDKRKRVSLKDIHIRSPRGIPRNVLSNTEHSLSFSSEDWLGIERREFNRLKKFRDFSVEEYSKTCYSKFSQSMLLNCSRLKKLEELKTFKKKMPFWAFLNDLFLLDNDGLNPEGYLPYFERQVLKEEYKRGTFTHSLMYWDNEFQKSRHLDSSIRQTKRKNFYPVKFSLLDLKL